MRMLSIQTGSIGINVSYLIVVVLYVVIYLIVVVINSCYLRNRIACINCAVSSRVIIL